jgi:hypothetical protein
MTSQYVTVEVDLAEFSTGDLIDELETRRDYPGKHSDTIDLINLIHEKRRISKDYQRELDLLIWEVLGKIV